MIVPAVFGALILGVAFDIKTASRKRPIIFDEEDLKDKLEIIKHPYTRSQYRITEASSNANDFLKVNGELGIKARKGQINIQGLGEYFSETVNRENTVEVLFVVEVETETHTFPSYTKLRTDWQDKSPDIVGTHYIRSITYGGRLLCTYRLQASDYQSMQDIKAALSANLALSGNININGSGKFEKVQKEVSSKSTIEIKVAATTSDPGKLPYVQNLQDLYDLVDKYPSTISGRGPPLRIEIIPLSTLTPKQVELKPNPVLDALLNEATGKYDDLKVSDKAFKEWVNPSKSYPINVKKMIDKYWRELGNALSKFDLAIRRIDPAKGPEQFDEALQAYGLNEENIPNRFIRKFKELKHTAENTNITWYPYTNGISHYIHWGSLNCTLPSPEPLYIGLAGTAPKGYGSGGSFECLPLRSPSLMNKPQPQDAVLSYMNGVQFNIPEKSQGPVLCAYCQLTNATSVYMIPGASECPGKTKLEYSGDLMTSKDSGTTSRFMCLDGEPQTNIPDGELREDVNSAKVTPVWMEVSDDFDTEKKYLGCVVCSR